MKIKVQTELFKSMIRAICLNGVIDTPTLVFKNNYLEAVNVDISQISLSACHFGEETFIEYDVTKDDEIGIEAGEVMKLIKHLSGDEITMSRDKDSMVIVTDREKLKIPTIETQKQKLPSVIKVEENGGLDIQFDSPFYMNEIIPVLKKELDNMGEDETRFVMKDRKLSVMQETTDGYLFQSVLKEEVKSDDFDIMFNTEYLKNVFDSVIDDKIQMRLGDSLPVVLENKTDNYQTIFLLMARIKND